MGEAPELWARRVAKALLRQGGLDDPHPGTVAEYAGTLRYLLLICGQDREAAEAKFRAQVLGQAADTWVMYSTDYGAPHKPLTETLIEATDRAVAASDLPGVTIGAILAEIQPFVVDYVEDYRRAALEVTEVVAYTLRGDPLRAVKR